MKDRSKERAKSPVKPRAFILRSAGSNCDLEAAFAFEQAGAKSELIHLNRLIESPNLLRDFQILCVPGGFSYGDDIAAGKILATQLGHHLYEPMREFVAAGKPIIGICNGFQVLVKTDLLPGPMSGATDRTGQTCTLTNNESGRFSDRWVRLERRSQKCIWTERLDAPFELPIAHGEGRFVPGDESIRKHLWEHDQIALVYVGENPNGSVDDIAGICDETGLIFGLMPHPERHVNPLQHPTWTRRATRSASSSNSAETNITPGLTMFSNAVRHVTSAVGSGI